MYWVKPDIVKDKERKKSLENCNKGYWVIILRLKSINTIVDGKVFKNKLEALLESMVSWYKLFPINISPVFGGLDKSKNEKKSSTGKKPKGKQT